MKDSVFSSALLASAVLHLTLLILGPAPAAPTGPAPLRLSLSLPVPPAETTGPDVAEPAAEPTPTALDTPETELPPQPEEAPSEPPAPQLPMVDLGPLGPPPPEARPEQPGDDMATAEDPEELAAAERRAREDAEDIEALLANIETESQVARADRRYRFQIREKIHELVTREHPRLRLAADRSPSRHFEIRFRVDPDGYLFDLSLITPPGAGREYRTLIPRLRELSPILRPPTELRTPVDFRFRIEVR